ncbi:MobQ family relaxase [Acetobacter pasteurianus]|uniref:MobQ family relaxase n=1 Tax=Acetobacter pasteurianus TaxID=438 RepID=UPI003D10CE2C
MAIYRAETKPISRKDGRSAVAAAAYRSGASLVDDRTGNVHDYTRRRGVVTTGIITPDGQGCERNALWNGAEAAEKRKDARTAREWVLALPVELTDAQRLELTERFSRSLAERFGVAVDFAIHRPGKEGDQRNHHAHVLTTTRQISRDASGALVFGDKAQPEQSDAQLRKQGIEKGAVLVEEVRALWETQANAALEAAGEAARIDRRSLKARGIDRTPTVHLGPSVTALERRGRRTEGGNLNRAIEQDNERKAALTAEIIDLQAERERRQREKAGVIAERNAYLRAREPYRLDDLLKHAADELAGGEARLRQGIVKDTPEYAQKTKEIRDMEARITEESRSLMYAERWRDDCEEEISEWSARVGFFARWRPPPEIREKKEQAEQARTNIRQTSGVLAGLMASLDLAKKLFKKWFLAEVHSPKLDARWRYRSLALGRIAQECRKLRDENEEIENKLREDALAQLREMEERQEARRQKRQVVERKVETPPSPVSGSPDPGDDFEDDWDNSPSLGM